MEMVKFNGWERNVRLANREVELIVTADVGPRVLRFAFQGGPNVFAEIPGQQGGTGEKEWMIRGGHRLWVAPEEKPATYEPDNDPVAVTEIPHGVRTDQKPGPITRVAKRMEITLAPDRREVRILHTLTNRGRKPVLLAPWALTVMAPGGMAIIPLPKKISHAERLTHNQEWSLWGYTDLSDPRWTLGSRYLFFRQDRNRGPNKLGIAHREGWVAYQLEDLVFIKYFQRIEGKRYPDGGVNFETFSNEQMLELESLGPLMRLAPGRSVKHEERWTLHRGVCGCRTEEEVDLWIRPLISE